MIVIVNIQSKIYIASVTSTCLFYMACSPHSCCHVIGLIKMVYIIKLCAGI